MLFSKPFSSSSMIFTFGKYAGYPLTEVPSSYLCYALEEFTIPEVLAANCRRELIRRLGLVTTPIVADPDVDLRVLIRQKYHELSKRYHPDKGGTTESMQALNDYYQALTT